MAQTKVTTGFCPIGPRIQKGTAGFTLMELMFCLTIVTILSVIALPMHLRSVEKAKAVEAQAALSEVVRLEQLHYASKGSYTSNLQELGFNLYSPLKYTQLHVQVRYDEKGWNYMALAMPLNGNTFDGGVWAVSRNAGGQAPSNSSSPTPLKGGGSPCSFWSGWASMEGGRIEGEETIRSSSSSTGGGGTPCGGMKVVNHGKK
jgi:prepilin-type N-terminal cleavage/methylation domain-containing protein